MLFSVLKVEMMEKFELPRSKFEDLNTVSENLVSSKVTPQFVIRVRVRVVRG
jgi:hypothetical protein